MEYEFDYMRSEDKQSFKRPLMETDWPRFQLYARRSKRLYSSRHWDPFIDNIEPSVFRAIENSLDLGHSNRPLLPSLSYLTWGLFNFDGISFQNACIFLSPRLTELSLSISQPIIGLEIFFRAIASNCLSLQNILIDNTQSPPHDDIGREVSSLVCGLSCLRETSFRAVVLNCNALIHLASRPTLRKLQICLPELGVLQSSLGLFPSLLFPALSDLYAHVISFADADKFLSNLFHPPTKSLVVDVLIPPARQLRRPLKTVCESSS